MLIPVAGDGCLSARSEAQTSPSGWARRRRSSPVCSARSGW